MKNKINNASIFITGANGGIGFETVKILNKTKAKKITLACRTLEKGQQAIERLDSTNVALDAYGEFDMANYESLNKAVAKLPKNKPFDIVFLQAGGMVVAEDFQFVKFNNISVEKTIFQNTIGGFLTVKLLEQHNLLASNARIVFAGGEGARGIKGMIQKPVYVSPEELLDYVQKGKGTYSDIDALGVSKFMSALLVQKLASRDLAREYIWFSPGLTAGTNGLRDVSPIKKIVMENVGFPMMQLMGFSQSPRKAAQKYVDCLQGIYGQSGDLIGAPEGKTLGNLVDQKPMNAGLTNCQFINSFWTLIDTQIESKVLI